MSHSPNEGKSYIIQNDHINWPSPQSSLVPWKKSEVKKKKERTYFLNVTETPGIGWLPGQLQVSYSQANQKITFWQPTIGPELVGRFAGSGFDYTLTTNTALMTIG